MPFSDEVTMHRRLPRISLILAGLADLVAPGLARATPAPLLDFRDIEYRYQGDDAVIKGKTEIADAISTGSLVADGVALLRNAGARCRTLRYDNTPIHCLYNQMSSDGDALNEVRWTILLQSRDGKVTNVNAQREVDVRVIN